MGGSMDSVYEPGSFRLTKSQLDVVKKVLERIYRIGASEARAEFARRQRLSLRDSTRSWASAGFSDDGDIQETFNFFVVDGERGTGKSTLVRKVCRLARLLGTGHIGFAKEWLDENEFEILKSHVLDVSLGETAVDGAARSESFTLIDRHPGLQYQTVHALDHIYPDMFGTEETELPDILFDQIRNDLQRQCERADQFREIPNYRAPADPYEPDRQQPRDPESFRQDKRMEWAKELLDELRQDIDPGWTFARHIGRDMLSRDSVNYREFVENKGKYSALASRRHILWRQFLEKYLDFKGAALMLVSLDDCDLSPKITRQLMHDLRLYLSHPRVVVVTAMRMESLGNVLKTAQYKELTPFFQAMRAGDWFWPADEEVFRNSDLYQRSIGLEDKRLAFLTDLYTTIEAEQEELLEQVNKVFPKSLRLTTPNNTGEDVDFVLFDGAQDLNHPFVTHEWHDQKTKQVAEASRLTALTIFFWRTRHPDLLTAYTMRELVYFKRICSEQRRSGAISFTDFTDVDLFDTILKASTGNLERRMRRLLGLDGFDDDKGVIQVEVEDAEIIASQSLPRKDRMMSLFLIECVRAACAYAGVISMKIGPVGRPSASRAERRPGRLR